MSLEALVTANELLCGSDAAGGIRLLKLEAPSLAQAARPGKFVMLKVNSGTEPLLARPFSIHGADQQSISILYQVVGKGTRILSQTEPGSRLSLWGPLGKGFELGAGKTVLVAGGMGVAPLCFAAARLGRLGVEVRLLCGFARGPEAKAMAAHLKKELNGCGAQISVATEDGGLGVKGLVTELMETHLPGSAGVLACGPMAMLKNVARLCAQTRTPCQVSLEAPMACGLGACLGCAVPAAQGGYLRACQEGPVLESGQVDWDRL